MKTYQNELNFAKELALKAGEIMLSYFSKTKPTIKQDFSPVTEADHMISRLVIDEVKKQYPHHAVLDEEIQNTDQSAEFLWVCDPIDGTIPFAHHIPTSVFSLALCKDKQPIVAVIYDPFMKRLLYSTENEKSYMNDQVTRVSDTKLFPGDTIFFIYRWFKNFNHNTFATMCQEKKLRITSIKSVVYLSMLVATGAIKAAIMPGAHPWDRAAAKLIVENAGGICSDQQGHSVTVFGEHQFFIASNKTVNSEVISMVKKCLLPGHVDVK